MQHIDTPRVSIVMACYNAQDHVARAIDSMLSQTFSDFEYIIIDDGSTDRTLTILDEYQEKDCRIIVLKNEKNLGLSASLNKGIRAARGEYIARMDADDWSYSSRLKRQVALLDTRPEIDILGTNVINVNEKDEEISISTLPECHHDIISRMFKKTLIFHPTILLRRQVYLKYGYYDPTLRWAEDADLWYRIYDQVTFHNIQKPQLRYTVKKRLTDKIIRNNLKVKYTNMRRRGLLMRYGIFLFSDLWVMYLRRFKNQ